MRVINKSRFLVLLAAMAIISCVKIESDIDTPLVEEEFDYVAFKIAEDAVSAFASPTRGSLVTSTTSVTSLSVWAYTTSDSNSRVTYIDNAQPANSSGTWAFTDTYYWPVTTTNFLAIYPSTTATSDKLVSTEDLEDTAAQDDLYTSGHYSIDTSSNADTLRINYVMPHDCASQKDILYSLATRESTQTSTSAVDLKMQHALAAVSFSVGGSTQKVVTKISISGLAKSGQMKISTSDGVTAWDLAARSENPFEATIYSTTDTDLSGDKYYDTTTTDTQLLTTSDGYLMVIPQTLSYELVEVYVTLQDPNDATDEGEEIVYSFDSDVIWEAGKIYNYVINLAGDALPSISTDGDYTSSIYGSSNCYILRPSSEAQTFYIPVEEQLVEFWGDNGYSDLGLTSSNIANAVWTAEVLWSDIDNQYINNTSWNGFTAERVTSGFTNTSSYTSAMKVTLPSSFYNEDTATGKDDRSRHGNIVVAVKYEGIIIWSWHFWITDYWPYNMLPTVKKLGTGETSAAYYIEADNEDDELHRFSDNSTATLAWGVGGSLEGKYMMDRNIGSTKRIESLDEAVDAVNLATGSLYYQFGRKDPFVNPNLVGDITYADGYEQSYEKMGDELKTMAESMAKPTTFFAAESATTGWCSDAHLDSNIYLWNDFKAYASTTAMVVKMKSLFDPSPLGWRLPTQSAFMSPGQAGKVDGAYQGIAYFPLTYVIYREGYLYTWTNRRGFIYTSTSAVSATGVYSSALSLQFGYSEDGSSNSYAFATEYRISGRPVRCVQE